MQRSVQTNASPLRLVFDIICSGLILLHTGPVPNPIEEGKLVTEPHGYGLKMMLVASFRASWKGKGRIRDQGNVERYKRLRMIYHGVCREAPSAPR